MVESKTTNSLKIDLVNSPNWQNSFFDWLKMFSLEVFLKCEACEIEDIFASQS